MHGREEVRKSGSIDFAEKTDAIISTDVMTGDKSRSRFLPVKNEHAGANRIDMVVSFLMELGGFAIL